MSADVRRHALEAVVGEIGGGGKDLGMKLLFALAVCVLVLVAPAKGRAETLSTHWSFQVRRDHLRRGDALLVGRVTSVSFGARWWNVRVSFRNVSRDTTIWLGRRAPCGLGVARVRNPAHSDLLLHRRNGSSTAP